MKFIFMLCLPLMCYTTSCKEDDNTNPNADMGVVDTPGDADGDNDNKALAEISSVAITGNENAYTFNVGIKSPETGCNQYADWWEVISEDGELLYRRILAHSHVNEQPFVRSGGPVPITQEQTVYIRAHMNTSGYGTKVFKGNASQGFTESTLDKTFATALETTPPLPNGCAF